MRDQSASSQQQQLISSVKGYLASTEGQTFLTAMAGGANAVLPMPSTAANAAGTAGCSGDANMTGAAPKPVPGFCNFLTAGTWTGTPNSYGQTFGIRVLKDGAAATVPPNSYSFMIVTSAGDVIPDTSGGRISAFVGSDGGFIYSSNVCNAQTGVATNKSACGAYGTWALSVATYGFAGTTSGTIATRTFISPTSSNTFPWLARPLMPGDNAASPLWNTMQTPLFLGAQTLFLGTTSAATTGGGTLNMQGGTISGTGLSNILITADGTTLNPLLSLNGNAQQTVNLITAANGCVISYNGATFTFVPAGCAYSVSTDNLIASGLVAANGLYSTTFIYTGSDIRLKANIHPLVNSLSDVMKLKPVSYIYKSNGMPSFGVIAQDLEKVYPQLVVQQVDGMKSVNYNGLIGPLIGAVQELKQENDDLRQKLRAEEKRQDQLEQEIKNNQAQ